MPLMALYSLNLSNNIWEWNWNIGALLAHNRHRKEQWRNGIRSLQVDGQNAKLMESSCIHWTRPISQEGTWQCGESGTILSHTSLLCWRFFQSLQTVGASPRKVTQRSACHHEANTPQLIRAICVLSFTTRSCKFMDSTALLLTSAHSLDPWYVLGIIASERGWFFFEGQPR